MRYLGIGRHGATNFVAGTQERRLSFEGQEDLRSLSRQLKSIVGDDVVVITSDQTHAMQSGRILANELKAELRHFFELSSRDTSIPVNVPRALELIRSFDKNGAVTIETHAEYCNELPCHFVTDDMKGREFLNRTIQKGCMLFFDFELKIIRYLECESQQAR
ncbi:MAG: hypothetical protein UT64_C0029G0010 [Candidatus Falkowbacteria bacterium GW2011_GWF2_39_8]|uniref:Uncharacterized protein n=1 Tax=Candidatus Falkowbacteria bacterium GW2011_GWF2_39_8 TaxID=1618642 RepID=A0A0G0Q5B4_9BACT|nr:MAG: hypothetical protein UT64_C0029G0010 [Candidatus Falkowbacteria bacterium GW2011_GWF2_39_8]